MKPTEKINEAKAAIAEAEMEMAEAELAASKTRTETRGWPIKLEDGSEVLVVRQIAEAGSGPVVVAEDGTEYVPAKAALTWVKAGAVLTEAELVDVEETGTAPPPAPEEAE